MPATAGRVRMPANNRVHSSAALQTHGIWQSAIGYDPYAPDQKQPPPTAAGGDRDAQASLSAPSADQQNAYDSFQGLLALARLTGSNADEARGACRKCGRVGHLPFQCRNFLVLKEEASLAVANSAAAASNLGNYPDGGNGSSHRKDRSHGKRNREDASGRAVSDLSSEDVESSEADESGLSDSSEDSEMERAIALKYGKNVLNSFSKKTHNKEQPRRKRSHSKRSKGERQVSSGNDSSASSKEDLKKLKHRSKSKRSHKDMVDSGSDEEGSDSESEEHRRRKRRRHSHKHSKSRSKHRSKYSDESSGGERTKRSKMKSSSRRQADKKHG